MKPITIKKATLITPLTNEEIIAVLTNNTAPFPNAQKIFHGQINTSGFTISRRIVGKNKFPLTIDGVIEADGNRRSVELSFSPSPLIVFIAVVWLTLAPLGAGTLFWKSAATGKFDPSALMPLAFLIFGFVIFRTAFGTEYDTCKYTLKDILEADEIIEN